MIKGNIRYFFKKFKYRLYEVWIDLRLMNFSKIIHRIKVGLKILIFGYPLQILIEPINLCNINCPMCSTPQRFITRKRMAMSFEDFKRIVNDVKDITHSIYLTNAGEPLLNKEIFRMIKYAEQNNLRVSLSTNATLLNKTAVKNLLNSGLDLLIVSIDGVSKSSYEKFRRGAIFEEVIRNVTFLCDQKKKMKKLKPIIEWQFIVTKLNQNELGKIKKLSKKMGVDRVRIKTLYLCSHIYDKHERKKFAEEFLPTRKDVKSRYEIKDNALICKWRSKTCTYWQKRSVILVDGTVCMCCYDINGEYIFGNVYLKSFKDIWNSKKYRYYRKYLIFNKKLPLCQRCQK